MLLSCDLSYTGRYGVDCMDSCLVLSLYTLCYCYRAIVLHQLFPPMYRINLYLFLIVRDFTMQDNCNHPFIGQ